MGEGARMGWRRILMSNQVRCVSAWEKGKKLNLKYVRINYKLDEQINDVEMIDLVRRTRR